jgi:hypothetical protein
MIDLERSSERLRDSFETASGFLREGFGEASMVLRESFGSSPMKIPQFPEGFPKNDRKTPEANTTQSPVHHKVDPKKTKNQRKV